MKSRRQLGAIIASLSLAPSQQCQADPRSTPENSRYNGLVHSGHRAAHAGPTARSLGSSQHRRANAARTPVSLVPAAGSGSPKPQRRVKKNMMRPGGLVALDRAARWVFGSFYALTGVWVAAATFRGMPPPHQEAAAAEAFVLALTASRIVDPLLAATYVAGGVAQLRRRTAPLGIVLLAPAVTVIFLFRMFLSGHRIWGSLNAAWLAGLAWSYRRAFTPLWQRQHDTHD